MSETQGQRDYERDVERRPFYPDGTARPTWHDLGPIAQWSWVRPHALTAAAPRTE